ncbi:DUF1152 domain-containing protein [Streptomyces sp. NPDC057717]|uniref:DUF1152 domain-containing protein n=1 Tax=unclassified Streptomyces TaxID=2593676 RepID=UPI00363AC805
MYTKRDRVEEVHPRPPDRLPRAPQPRAPPAATTADSKPSTSGVRGRCEVRDAGLPVPLTDEGPTLHKAELDAALNRNERARAVLATETLAEAEQHSREVCGYSEIDYERNKASRLSSQVEQKLDPEAVLRQLDQFEAQARARGIARTAFRRLTEVFGLNGKQRQDLRALLLSSRPEQYEAPLRRIPAEASGLGVSGEA